MKNKIKAINLFLVLVSGLVLLSCSNAEKSINEQGEQSLVSLNFAESDADAGLTESTTGSVIEVSVSGDTQNKSEEETGDNKETADFASITEYFRQCDKNRNESGEYQDAVRAYENALGEETISLLIEESGGDPCYPRISSGYVDEDDVPELFLAIGDYHTSGVYVFTYLPDTEDVVRVGEFSSYGHMSYVEKGNRIRSQYGSMGSFITMYTKIADGKPGLVGSVAKRERLKEEPEEKDDAWVEYEDIYYAGYKLQDEVDGSIEYSDAWDWPDNDYIVSEEDYEKADISLRGSYYQDDSSMTEVDFDAMNTVIFSQGGENLLKGRDELDQKTGEDILRTAFPERAGEWMAYQRIYEVEKEAGPYVDEDETGYDVMDLNGDGTLELVVFKGKEHLDGVKLYTFADNKAVYLGCFGEWGRMEADPDKHYIRSTFTGFGSVYEKYYEIKKDTVVELAELDDVAKKSPDRQGVEHIFRVNGSVVSRDEYEQKRNKFSDCEFLEFKIGTKHGAGWLD